MGFYRTLDQTVVVNAKRFLLNPEFHYSQVHVHDMEAAKKIKKIFCK